MQFSFSRYDIKDTVKETGTTSTLLIRSVDVIDEGHYQCVAENIAGKDDRSIRVTIIGKILELSSRKRMK